MRTVLSRSSLLAAAALLGATANAASITKSGTGTDLAAGASWNGAIAPTSADVATWDSTSLGAGLTIATTVSWAGISVSGALTDIVTSGAGSINLGSSGISLSGVNMSIGNAIALGAGQTWTVASTRTLTLGGIISGSSTLTYGGAGSYLLNGVNTNSGNLTIDTAKVTVGNSATLFGSGLGWAGRTVTLVNGGTLVANNFANGAGSLWGQIGDGANNIIFGSGGGTFEMTGATMDSTVNKGFTVNSSVTGNFKVGTGLTSTWQGSYSGRDFTVNGTLNFQIESNGAFSTSRIISGGGALTKNGSGTLTLTGANTFTGKTTISGGVLKIDTDTRLGAAPSGATADQLTLNGGTLALTAGFSTSNKRGITLGASGGTIDTSALSTSTSSDITGVIAGTSSGSLTLKANGDTSDGGGGVGGNLKLSGTNTFAGAITITAGLVSYAGDSAFGNSANVITLNNGGLVDATGGAGPTLAHAIKIADATTGYFRLYSNGVATWSGAITGIASTNIRRTDSGTLTLSGDLSGFAGTYYNVSSAKTIVTYAGTIGGSWSVGGSGDLTFSNASTLTAQTLNGVISGSGGGKLVKSGAGKLSLGNAANTFSGTVDIQNGTLEVTVGTSGGYPSALGNQGNTINVGQSGILLLSGGSRTVGYHQGSVNITGGKITFNTADNSFAAGKTIAFDTSAGTIDGSGQLRRRDANNKVTVSAAATGSTISVTDLNLYDNQPMFDIAATATLNVSSKVTGGAGIKLNTNTPASNTGTMVLSSVAAGSSVGNITIGAGTLEISGQIGSGTTGTYTGTITNSGVLKVSSDSPQLMSGLISGTGSLTKSGSGVLTISNTGNDYSGATTVSAGTLLVSGLLGAGSYAGNISLAGGTLKLTNTSNQVLSGNLSGAGTLWKAAGGTLSLSGASASAGTAQIDAGVLSLASGLKLTLTDLTFGGNAQLTIASLSNSTPAFDVTGTLTLPGSLVLNLPTTSVLNDTYHIIKHGNVLASISGVSLDATNRPALGGRQTGTLVDQNGYIDYVVAGSSPYWSGSNSAVWDTSSLNWKLIGGDGSLVKFLATDAVLFDDNVANSGPQSISINSAVSPNSVLFNNGTGTAYTLGGSSGIDSGTLTKNGVGTLTINNANTYTGGTTLSAGEIRLGNDGALGAGKLTLAGGRLAASSSSPRSLASSVPVEVTGNVSLGAAGTGALAIAGSVDLKAGTRTLTVDSDVTLSGAISNGSLTKAGNGKLTLSGSSTFSGSDKITVSTGVLQVGDGATAGSVSGPITNNAEVIFSRSDIVTYGGLISGTGVVTVAGTGTLKLTGANTYSGVTTVNSGASLTIGNGAGSGSVASTSLVANGTLVYDAGSSSTAEIRSVTGTGGSVTSTSSRQLRLFNDITLTGAASSITLGHQGDGTYLYGIELVRSNTAASPTVTTLTAGSISISADIGKADSEFGSSLALDTSANNGTIDLNVSLGRTTVFYKLNAMTATAGSGAININGTGKASSGWRDTAVSLSGGAVNFNAAVNSNATVTVNNSATSAIGYALSGSMSLVKRGNGTLTMSGAHTFTGAIQANGGTLEMISGSWTGGNNGNQSALEIGSAGSDVGEFKISGGVLNLTNGSVGGVTGNNAANGIRVGSYGTGTFTQTGGTVAVGGAGIWIADGSSTSVGTMRLSAGSLTNMAATVVGTRGNATLTVDGSANVTLGAVQFGHDQGGSSQVAKLNLDGGTLTLNGLNRIAGVANIYFNGGTLKAGASSSTWINNTFTSAEIKSGGAFIDTNGNDVTIVQAINDYAGNTTGGLTKSGAGALTLTGTNGYAAGTTVSNGTLRVGNNSALGTGGLTLGDGVAFTSDSSTARTLSGNLTISGAVNLGTTDGTKNGALTFSGTVGFGGGNRTLTVDSAVTFGNTVSNGGLTKAGNGTLTLNAANSYSGGTTINAGKIALGNGDALGTNSVTVNTGGTLDAGAYTVLNNVVLGGGTLSWSSGAWLKGNISETGGAKSLTVASNLKLSGANTFSGGTNVTAGTLTVGSVGALGSSGAITVNGGVLDLASYNLSGTGRTITINSANGLINYGAFTGTIISNVASFTLGATAGATSVSTGNLLTLGAGGTGGSLAVDSGAALNLAGYSRTFTGGITLGGAGVNSGGALYNNAGTASALGGGVTLGSSATISGTGDIVLSGVVSGAGKTLTKDGAGKLTLSGAGNAIGTTEVQAGTLLVSGGLTGDVNVTKGVFQAGTLVVNGTVTGAVSIASGTTLGGSGTIVGATTIYGDHRPGNSPGVQTFAGDLSYEGGSTFTWDLWKSTQDQEAPAIFDQVRVTSGGNLNFNGAVTLSLDFGNSSTSTMNWNDGFWDGYHRWTVFSVSGGGHINLTGGTKITDLLAISGTGDSFGTSPLTTYGGALTDSTGATNGLRAQAGFYLTSDANNVYLNYRPIPEPGTYGLALGGLALAAAAIRRRRQAR